MNVPAAPPSTRTNASKTFAPCASGRFPIKHNDITHRMKLTTKQNEEIVCLSSHNWVNNFTPTQEEIEQYIRHTVHGSKEISGKLNQESNRLFVAKRMVDISVKAWREDLTRGLLSTAELLEDAANCLYEQKLISSTITSITPEYRRKVFSKSKEATILAFTNFPAIIKQFTHDDTTLAENGKSPE